jgi:transcriptional regulator with XRE-family HTH domain
MTTATIELLDAWKAAQGITSDNQAALALGVVRQAISKWRNGQAHPAPPFAARMAKDLGRDELATLAAIEADRAIDGDTKRTWSRLARKRLGVALLALAAVGAPTLPGRVLAASQAVTGGSAAGMYIMFRSRRWSGRRRDRRTTRRARAVKDLRAFRPIEAVA